MKALASAAGGVTSAVAASLCCAGPLLYVAFGVGGAGLAATFEPLRPWFLGAAALLLGAGWWSAYRRGPRCAGDADAERRLRRQRRVLWVATGLALIAASFPAWSVWLL